MMAARAGALAVACLVAAVAAALLASPASAQSGSCTTTLISLYPCLNYISGNVSTPPSSCCSQLASVVQSKPQCLCAALSGDSSSLGVTIDKKRALELPKACNVDTPPASKCNSAGGGNAPGAATPTTPSAGEPATAGASGGSKATPTAPYLTSGAGASIRGAVSLALAFAAVAVYAALATV
ncbi:non-specific lipid transfer protein GPI-anchored 5-like [Panicum virgatum]|uniref:Bifunctional inhibitor/plant lipid transfer protein/seed storage helical domain-containing protein n=1 Tax=Panicum virgatum TaxID=38727 RepID=A0A8T0MEW7_PANVG|nr:non-specific lipid transfer protein GPI-anchored 5-like [Panicum virgatum]KAG2534642.1 hypothetical protein PVAP13_9NG073512 [Panicum virgatum]